MIEARRFYVITAARLEELLAELAGPETAVAELMRLEIDATDPTCSTVRTIDVPVPVRP